MGRGAALTPRTARPTLRDVAQRAGVSPMTVSNVVNGRRGASADTRRRVERAIAALGYERDARAHALRVGTSPALGLVLEDDSRLALYDPVHAGLLTGLVEAARHAGRTVTVLVASPATLEAQVQAIVRGRGVAGLLLSLQAAPDRHAALLGRLAEQRVPTVVFELDPGVPGIDAARSDNEGGGRRLAEHLTALGHRRVGIITGRVSWPGGERRLAGFRAGLDPAAEVATRTIAEWSAEAARVAALGLLREARPTAVLAANDLLAVGVLQAAAELGLRVPDDVSVAGFDDLDVARLVRPALTTVRVDVVGIGEWAAGALEARLRGETPEPRAFATTLVPRESTGPAPAGS